MKPTIADLAAELAEERPRHADLTDALLDLLKSVLSADRALPVPEAVEIYMKALDAHIDRRVSRYMRGAGEIAP